MTATIAPVDEQARGPRRSRRRRTSSGSAGRAGSGPVRSPGRRRSARGTGGRPGSAYSAAHARAQRQIAPSSSPAGRRAGRTTIGEARTAVGAADERVPVPPVGRIGQLGQAVGAGRDVRRDQRAAPPALRRRDDELGATPARAAGSVVDRLDPGQRRSVGAQPAAEVGQPLIREPSTSTITPSAGVAAPSRTGRARGPARRRTAGSRRLARGRGRSGGNATGRLDVALPRSRSACRQACHHPHVAVRTRARRSGGVSGGSGVESTDLHVCRTVRLVERFGRYSRQGAPAR